MTYLHRSGLLLALILTPLLASADEHSERNELTLLLRQIDGLGSTAKRSQHAALTAIAPRYSFDYPQLNADLGRISQGIQHYLTPSRAQPSVPPALSGDYRLEAISQESGHEHD